MALSCWHMLSDSRKTIIAYILSGLLDAVDGHAARSLNQSTYLLVYLLGTKFGAMLDMLVDRCATMCLLVALAYFYPNYMFLFQLSMSADIASHWLHMHTSLATGKNSHKSINLEGNAILKLYYTNRVVYGLCIFKLIAIITAPVAFAKFCINLIHLHAASVNLAGIDAQDKRIDLGKH
ncbi:unnamed protein product [Protopolystoma xenopodis]|uniref:CDP-diacylglycerol--inositol 3-phosphatidyltransferase n=1 Tax=Protopolystoma xenopodis TaxID=117903 RepID=A0A448WH19_9PLAT|nr:unnamed protein product [Protopolystoma xenopodis]